VDFEIGCLGAIDGAGAVGVIVACYDIDSARVQFLQSGQNVGGFLAGGSAFVG
jgi:hypothetical protein